MKNISIKRCYDFKLIDGLNNIIFPNEPLEYDITDINWLAYDNKKPIGFASLHPLKSEPDYAFLSRAGVLPKYRGLNIQRRLIRVRKRFSKSIGLKGCITYTAMDNYASAVNLQHEGFKIYGPENPWAGNEFIYFMLLF